MRARESEEEMKKNCFLDTDTKVSLSREQPFVGNDARFARGALQTLKSPDCAM